MQAIVTRLRMPVLRQLSVYTVTKTQRYCGQMVLRLLTSTFAAH